MKLQHIFIYFSVLDNPDFIKHKIEMMDNLLEIEVAYSILKNSGNADSGDDPIDVHYKKLDCQVEVLDKKTNDFEVIKKYVENTHASTHNLFDLEIEDVFKINRKGESTRYIYSTA